MDLPIFRHYLNFKNDALGVIEISEPEGFDAASFTIMQEKDNLGNDVRYMSDDINLKFNDGFFEVSDSEILLPNGEVSYHLTQGYPFIMDYRKRYGFEAVIEYILEKDGAQFVTGVLDIPKSKTNNFNSISCAIIDNDDKAKLKRNFEVNVDLFSDKDLDGNPIEPIQTTNILLKAKPVKQVSTWTSTGNYHAFDTDQPGENGLFAFNFAQQIQISGIDNTLTWFEPVLHDNTGEAFKEIALVKAKTKLTDVTIKHTVNFDYAFTQGAIEGVGYLQLRVYTGEENDLGTGATILHNISLGLGDTASGTINQTFETVLPLVQAGQKIWLFWVGFGAADCDLDVTGSKMETEITAASTSIDSVIKGVRWGDIIKQNVKRVNGFDTVLPRFEPNGQFYDQFVFNGKLIRQFTDKPFYTNLKNTFETLKEVNGHYKINADNCFVGLESDFYPNTEIASFLQAPDTDYEELFAEPMSINRVEYKYKTYESDRDEKNTLDSMHTESQFKLPNKQVESVKVIEVEQIRDANAIESARRQGINTKDTTALDNDDKLYLLDCIALAPSTKGGFAAVLLMRNLGSGKLEILNTDLEGEGENFNWTLLGFKAGAQFFIDEGENVGVYTVTAMTSSLLTLQKVSGTLDFTGEAFIKVSYYLNDVTYVNRTSEGFTEINNILNGTNYSNLLFTPKRNLLNYYASHINTASTAYPQGECQNTFFKNNGEAETNFNNEGIIKENTPISISGLTDKLISIIKAKTRLHVPYHDALDVLNAEVQGFIRTLDNQGKMIKIYPDKLDYEWISEVMNVTGYIKHEPDTVTITSSEGIITINDTGYALEFVTNGDLQTSGNFLTLFDSNSIPLINPTNYTKISVNGIFYDNITDLSEIILNL